MNHSDPITALEEAAHIGDAEQVQRIEERIHTEALAREAGRKEGFENARARAAAIARAHVCMSQQDVDNVEDDIADQIEAMK